MGAPALSTSSWTATTEEGTPPSKASTCLIVLESRQSLKARNFYLKMAQRVTCLIQSIAQFSAPRPLRTCRASESRPTSDPVTRNLRPKPGCAASVYPSPRDRHISSTQPGLGPWIRFLQVGLQDTTDHGGLKMPSFLTYPTPRCGSPAQPLLRPAAPPAPRPRLVGSCTKCFWCLTLV